MADAKPLVRIFASAKVDHLSQPVRDKAPLCGQKLRTRSSWCISFSPYPHGVHLCARCAALAEAGEPA